MNRIHRSPCRELLGRSRTKDYDSVNTHSVVLYNEHVCHGRPRSPQKWKWYVHISSVISPASCCGLLPPPSFHHSCWDPAQACGAVVGCLPGSTAAQKVLLGAHHRRRKRWPGHCLVSWVAAARAPVPQAPSPSLYARASQPDAVGVGCGCIGSAQGKRCSTTSRR